jgi:hypothetical protein
MTRVQPLFLVLLTAALLVGMPAVGEAQITVSLPELIGDSGERIDIQVTTDDLTDLEVTAFFFTLAYNPEVVSITDVFTEGTLSEGMILIANTDIPGELRVAASHSEPLVGSGVLLELKTRYVGRGDSELRWIEFEFNEGDPATNAVDGSAAVRIGLEGGIGVSLPDIAGLAGGNGLLSVEVEELNGQEVYSYLFSLAYDPRILRISGISTAGTISEGMSVQANSPEPGRFSVAASGSDALAGRGSLIDLEVEFIGGGTSPLRWTEFVFNERDPAPNPTDAQVTANGEIVFNEVHNGPAATVDWMEMLVVADRLDLRGYRVRGANGEGYEFADDPIWEDLRRGTLILVGGNDAPLPEDTDPGDFVVSVRHDPFAPGLLNGDLVDIQEDADEVQVLRPSGEPVFTILWGGAGPVQGFHVDLGADPLLLEANIAFSGGDLAGLTDAAEWEVVDGGAGTPRQGNGLLNGELLSTLRGGAEVVKDIEVGLVEVALPILLGQVGRIAMAPIQISDVTGLDVLSYLIAIDYDPEILKITDVSIESTISADMNIAVNVEAPGRFTVAASSAQPLRGAGSLLDLEVEYVGPGTTELILADLQVNEGEPRALGVNGEATARVGTAAGVGLRLPETTGIVGQTVTWPVEIDDVTGLGVTGFLFAIAYDSLVVDVTGVSVVGTVSAGATIEANADKSGQVIVAGLQTEPLSGSGVLLELQVEYVGRGTTDLEWTNLTFNEGEVAGAPVDGKLEVQNVPLQGVDDDIEVEEDTATGLAVLANDDDPDGDPLMVSWVSEPEVGTVEIDPDSTGLIYTPPEDYNGPDSFSYEMNDGIGDVDTAFVNITVLPANDPPVGVDNEATALQDSALTIFAVANDLDPDGDRLVIESVTQPENGTVVIGPGNISIIYTPNPGFRGQDSFTYRLVDGDKAASEATITIEVLRTNDAPVAADDAVETEEDIPVVIQVLDGDTDADGDELTVTEVSDPANGTVELDAATGEVRYAPAGEYSGPDSFTYTISDPKGATSTATVSVTVTPVNDAPVAVDDAGETEEDVSVTIGVEDNDTDADGEIPVITGVGDPANGIVEFDAETGEVTYTPLANYNGPDSFTYTIGDAEGATSTATVSVTVTPVSDPPVAVDDAVETEEDASVTAAVVDNDTDADGEIPTITDVSDPSNGSVEFDAGTGEVTYTPDADYNGPDSFTYTISDAEGATSTGAVDVTVTPVSDPPVAEDDTAVMDEDASVVIAVVANDTDADGETPTLTEVGDSTYGSVDFDATTGEVTYTPSANYNGPDSFMYTISDAEGATSTGTVDVTVMSINDAPVAEDDTVETAEDEAVVIDVSGNDTDADGDALTVAGVSQPSNGLVEIAADGSSVTYTPDPNFSGEDSFTYDIEDPEGVGSTATAMVTVAWINDAPVAVDDAAPTDEDAPVAVDVLENDDDPDSEPLIITDVSQPSSGSVEIAADESSVTYTPDADFNGEDSFTYTISDSTGETATGTVDVTVTPVNDAPEEFDLLSPADGSGLGRETVAFSWEAVKDVDGDAITYELVVGAGGSEVTLTTGETSLEVDLLAAGFPGEELAGTWSVSASDGEFSVEGIGGDRAFTLEILAPEMVVDVGSLDFGEVVIGARESRTVNIGNQGNAELTVSGIASTDGQFGTSSGSVQVPPGESRNVEVRFAPVLPGAQSGELVIASDDAGQPEVKVSLSGSGSGIEVWPGDTNGDGLVDGRDVMPIGMFWEAAGAARPLSGTTWEARGVASWVESLAALADADGNGVVNVEDILPVAENWRQSRSASKATVGGGIDVEPLEVGILQAMAEALEAAPVSTGADELLVFLRHTIEIRMLPKRFALLQNAPNPFNPTTTIRYAIPSGVEGGMRLRIFDVTGQLVRTLVEDPATAGQHEVVWDGRDQAGRSVASGVYLYRMETGEFAAVRRMLLVR